MDTDFLAVVTPPPDIYHGFSTQKTLREEKFTPAKVTSCGRLNGRKHRDTKNCEQYIILDISSNIDCVEKREVTSSESNDYMGIPGKGTTNSLYLSTKRQNKKKKARSAINGITKQYFRKLIRKF